MNYLIIDTTANHEGIYIDAQGENCSLEENAMVFASNSQAQQFIYQKRWKWASAKETDLEVNM